MGLPKHRRLRRPKEFRHVLSSGKRARDALVAVAATRNKLRDQPPRFGFSVSRRVGGAVVRNRVKRRLSEIMHNAPIQDGWDLVVTAYPPSADSDSSALRESLTALSSRLRIALDQHRKRIVKRPGARQRG